MKSIVLSGLFLASVFVFLNTHGFNNGKSGDASQELTDNNGTVISGKQVDVMQELQQISNLTSSGPDLNFEILIISLEDVFDWKIPLIIDDACLRKYAIQLSEVDFPTTVEAGDITRRSSLRFVLDLGGVGYFVDGNRRIVVTTKPLARIQWLTQLNRPKPQDLSSTSTAVRREAAFSVAFFDVDSDDWIRPLISSLDDADKDVRFDSVYALGEFGPQAEASIDSLCKLLRSNDLTLRAAATNAVAKVGPKAAGRLLELINDPDQSIALAAVTALGMMGSAGNDSVPALIAAGKHISTQGALRNIEETRELYLAIGSSLSKVELGDAVPLVRKLLDADSSETRAFAAFTIGEIGPSAQECEPELQSSLSDSSANVRMNAAYALSRLDLPNSTSTTALKAATNDSDYHVRLWAAEALRVINSNR